jgi:hypothetical protein
MTTLTRTYADRGRGAARLRHAAPRAWRNATSVCLNASRRDLRRRGAPWGWEALVSRRDTHVSWLTVSALARVASRFEACSRAGLRTLDVDVGEPLKPGRQVPVALAEQLHRGRDQYEADDGGVE